jgi:Skp family chaperone for outer membrane proteins
MTMRRAVATALVVLAGYAPLAAAQDASAPTPPFSAAQPGTGLADVNSPILALDQQFLFEGSAFGQASLSRLEMASRDLQAEIRKIESDLEIEERLLTERRQTLQPAEFQPLAAAFDEKVEQIRAAWGAKDRELKRQRDQDRQTFYETAVPVLAEMMQEMGAVMLVDKANVILSLDRVDITQIAIDRLDARLSTPPEIAPILAPQAPPAAP